jgi:ribosomal protein L29
MKISDLRQKNTDELNKLLLENTAKMSELKFDLEGGKVKNVKGIRTAKIDIARIKTLLREAEINQK